MYHERESGILVAKLSLKDTVQIHIIPRLISIQYS